MPNKTYAAILGDKANINLGLSDYIQQQVKHNNNKNDMMSLETEYRLFLQSKKSSKPKFKDIQDTHKLKYIRVGDLWYSPKVNARLRTGTNNDRKKIYSLANEWNNDYLDAIHVQVIDGKYYVGEGMKRATAAILNFGPDYLIPSLVDYSNQEKTLTNEVVKKANNIFESINNGRDRLDSFTYYFSLYVQGDKMAKAVIETMLRTGYNFTPDSDSAPQYNGLKTIEKIYKLAISGDSDSVSLENKRGPHIQTVFKHHREVYGDEKPHNSYVLTFTAFLHHFDSDKFRINEKQLNFVMENAKSMNIREVEKDGHMVKVGIKTGDDFASKWGLGLKGKSGVPQGMRLISELWNKCYDNVPGGKQILQSNIDTNYFSALIAKGSSDYKYSDYLFNPLYPKDI